MGGGAWPFLVGGVCLVNSVNAPGIHGPGSLLRCLRLRYYV